MDKEIIETTKNLSPILIAAIGAIGGLLSGTIASLISPWVHHAIESRKKSIEYKSNLIKEIRFLVDQVESIKEIRTSSLWGFIADNLSESEKEIVFPTTLSADFTPYYRDELTDDETRKEGISRMLSRLEKEWKLT